MAMSRQELLWGQRSQEGNPYAKKKPTSQRKLPSAVNKPAKSLAAREAGPARVARLGGAIGKGGTAGQKRDRIGRFA